jgi:cytochrome P450
MQNTSLLVTRLKRHARENRVFDLQDLFFRFTLDSFAEIAFGETTGCLSDGAPVPFAQAFDLVQMHTSARFFGPSWKIKRALNIGSERIVQDNVQIIKVRQQAQRRKFRSWSQRKQQAWLLTDMQCCVFQEFGVGVIERTRRAREQDKSEKPDLLSRFIEYAEANKQSTDNTELLDIALNFIIAGRDTTACLLSWAAYELTQHPELQERLHAECEGLSETDSSHSARDLPLLHAFIMETLRLHPSVPQEMKVSETTQASSVSDD